jgi:uncharacterized protein
LKKSSFVIFFSIVFTVYGLVNFYIFKTGLAAIPGDSTAVYISVFLFLSLSYIAGRFLERKFLNRFSSVFVWIGSFWLAAMVYFLAAAVLIDLIRLADVIFGFLSPAVFADGFKFDLFALIVIMVSMVVFAGYINARNPVIRRLNIDISKKANGLKRLRIAAASDIHLGTIICRNRLKMIVEKINSLNADIVFLPGDVVDEDIGPVIKQNLGELLRNIRSKYGVYAITGNHEYIGGVEPAMKYLTDHGITELRDSFVKIADSFYVIGREDRASKQFAGKLRKPLSEIMTGIEKSLPLILMDHQPVKIEEAEKNGIDLQLSGHTHHGQLWPFNFITKKIYEVSMGYKKKSNTHYYVSCGVGTWGPPIRTGNRPEVVQIELTFS